MSDEHYMRAALAEARKAYKEGEVPVGAVVVFEDQIIARGHNQVELLKDATAHAEMLAIGSAAQSLDNWRLLGTTLYSTVEPCVMCAGAMYLSRIKRLVWGAPDLRHGACGSWVDITSSKHPTHTFEITSGVLQDACAALMREFFHERRNSTSS